MSDVRVTTKTIGGEISIWDSEKRRFLTGGITVDYTTVAADGDGNRLLKAGQPMGRIAASGKYGPYDVTDTLGRETAVCLLAEAVDCTLGDEFASAVDEARVVEGRLPVAITAAIKADLPHITFVTR